MAKLGAIARVITITTIKLTTLLFLLSSEGPTIRLYVTDVVVAVMGRKRGVVLYI